MVRHVRVRLVNGLCHGLTDGNGLRLCEGLINGESCPREIGQRTLSRIHGWKRIWAREGLIGGEACPREVVNGLLRRTDERKLCRLDFDPNDVKLIKNSEVTGFRVLI